MYTGGKSWTTFALATGSSFEIAFWVHVHIPMLSRFMFHDLSVDGFGAVQDLRMQA